MARTSTHVLRRIAVRTYIALHLLRVAFWYNVFGIAYVSRELSKCSALLVPILLKRYGANIGSGVNFKDIVLIDNAEGDRDAKGDFSNLTVGDNCYVGKGVFFDLPDRIEIQADCAISARAMFITHADCGDRPMSKWYPRRRRKITIGRGCWIGVGAVILDGVNLGDYCVVAAGAVVGESFGAYSVVAGAPARLVKQLSQQPFVSESHID